MKSVAGTLAAPFPYFGGKSLACETVWATTRRTTSNRSAGSAAMLLGRPNVGKVETINDADGFVANFWQCAVSLDAAEVAKSTRTGRRTRPTCLRGTRGWCGTRAACLSACTPTPSITTPRWPGGGAGACAIGSALAGAAERGRGCMTARRWWTAGNCRTLGNARPGREPATAAPGQRGPGREPATAAPGNAGPWAGPHLGIMSGSPR